MEQLSELFCFLLVQKNLLASCCVLLLMCFMQSLCVGASLVGEKVACVKESRSLIDHKNWLQHRFLVNICSFRITCSLCCRDL